MPDALGLLSCKCFAPAKRRFAELDDPPQAGFVGRDVGIDLVTVQRHRRFQSQGVPRSEAARLDSFVNAGVQDAAPDPFGFRRRDVCLESILARVACAGDRRLAASERALAEPVVSHRRQIEFGEPARHRESPRTLDGKLGVAVANEGQLGVEPIPVLHPCEVRILVCGVDAKEIVILSDAVNQQVIDEPAIVVEQPRVLRLTITQTGGSVRAKRVNQVHGLRAADFNFAHVAHVEEPHGGAYRGMLGDDSRVLDWHVPAAEVGHSGSCLAMHAMQGSTTQGTRTGGFSHMTDTPPLAEARAEAGRFKLPLPSMTVKPTRVAVGANS